MRVNPVLVFFTLAGAAMVVVSHLPGVTEFLDANSSAGSDPAGPVLQMIGWIWLAVSLIPLIFSIVAKRKGVDRMFRSFAAAENEDEADEVRVPADIKSFATLNIGGSPQAAPAGGLTQSLEQLAKLHETGVLNDEQFAQAKTQLLNQPTPPASS